MDAFLVPTGADHYELYSETTADHDAAPPAGARPTRWARLMARVNVWVAEGEDERRRAVADEPPAHRWLRRAITTRFAQIVAGQRLLWALRHTTDVRLVHPDDMTADAARAAAHLRLRRDVEKHVWWAAIDTLIVLATLPLALVPGPNVVGYYFLFRAVAHGLSWRGARVGLRRAVWQPTPSPALTALRATLTLGRRDRLARTQQIARGLGLAGLTAFLDGVVPRPS